MKPYLVLMSFTLSLMLVGCGEYTHDDAVEELLDISEDMVEVFKSIEDVDSAKASGDKMQDIVDRYEAVAKKLNELEKPTEEQEKAMDEKYKDRIEKLRKDMRDEGLRISKLGPEIQQALKDNAPDMDMEDIEMPDWMM